MVQLRLSLLSLIRESFKHGVATLLVVIDEENLEKIWKWYRVLIQLVSENCYHNLNQQCVELQVEKLYRISWDSRSLIQPVRCLRK